MAGKKTEKPNFKYPLNTIMKKTLLYAHTGSANHGCEAIVRGTQKIIGGRPILFSQEPDDDFKYKLDEIVEIEKDIVVPVSNKKNLDYYLKAIRYKLNKSTLAITKQKRSYILSKIEAGDLCLSIGGDNYTYKGAWELGDYNRLIKQKKAKTALWGCSVDQDLIPSFKNDLNRYNIIIARESITFNALKKNGISTQIRLCADPAFQLDPKVIDLPEGFLKNGTIGLNLSPLVFDYGNAEIIRANFENLIKHILNNTELNIALIPHVVRPDNDDREAMKDFYEKFKDTNRMVWVDDYNCMELKFLISNCRFFIGARTHATIAAYSTEIPAIAIGYSMKAKGIAKDIFGTYENFVCSVQNFENDNELTQAFEWLLENEENIRQHYAKMMIEYKASALNAADYLKEIK